MINIDKIAELASAEVVKHPMNNVRVLYIPEEYHCPHNIAICVKALQKYPGMDIYSKLSNVLAYGARFYICRDHYTVSGWDEITSFLHRNDVHIDLIKILKESGVEFVGNKIKLNQKGIDTIFKKEN
jgi:hypothetical protein